MIKKARDFFQDYAISLIPDGGEHPVGMQAFAGAGGNIALLAALAPPALLAGAALGIDGLRYAAAREFFLASSSAAAAIRRPASRRSP